MAAAAAPRVLKEVQGSLSQLLYRYLATRIPGREEEADRKTRLLLSLVDDVHDCAETMNLRFWRGGGREAV